jgi:hypothetical protein
MAINDSAYGNAIGDYSDWIEIYNGTGSTTNLVDWFLSDNPADLQKWRFPSAAIADDGYLLVFADGSNAVIQSEIHSNFKLAGSGEYLALVKPDGTTIAHEYNEYEYDPGEFGYPPQSSDVSYGIDANGIDLRYFQVSTPGLPNASGLAGIPGFSHAGGIYTNGFLLELTTGSSNEVIRYTLDGSIPTITSAIYTTGNPVLVSNTTQIRARVFETGLDPGQVVSHSFIFLDPDMQSFSSDLPIVVIDTFGAVVPGTTSSNHAPVYTVFIDTDETGRAWMHDVPDFTGRGGILTRGNSSSGWPKHPYSLETWDEYNEDRNVLLLGFPSESDWILQNPYADKTLMRNYLTYLWSRNLGQYAVRTRFVEVFLNAGGGNVKWGGGAEGSATDYMGVYVFMEKIKRDKNRVNVARLDPSDAAEPEVSGGYIIKVDHVDLNDFTFTTAHGMQLIAVEPDHPSPAQVAYLLNYLNEFETTLYAPTFTHPVTGKGYDEYIDVDAFIDHHLMVELTRNRDSFLASNFMHKDRNGKLRAGPNWDHNLSLGNNEVAPWNDPIGWHYLVPGYETYRLFPWYRRLNQNVDYHQKWIDRWSELLRDRLALARMFQDIDEVTNTVNEAQARNFLRYDILGKKATKYDPPGWTDRDTYEKEVDWMKDWLTTRFTWLWDEFLEAPEFNQDGGLIADGFPLTLTASTGTIYYTLNRLDPRSPGGSVFGGANSYATSPIILTENTLVRARARNGGEWSGLTEAVFVVTQPTVAVSEVMYHPQDPQGAEAIYTARDFEFVELRNIGLEVTSLLGVEFSGGITFDFTYGDVTSLAPGGHVVAVRNLAAFKIRYPNWAGISIAGEYQGGLDASGEQITLENSLNQTNLFSYNDAWFPSTDGEGFSLTVIDPGSGDLNSKSAWRHSAYRNGSPGEEDPELFAPPGSVVINEVLSHQDSDDPGDWIELRNMTAGPLQIGGWYLSDTETNLTKFSIPGGTEIPGSGTIVFTEHDDFGVGALPADGFALNELGDTVYLSAGTNGMLAEPAYRESEDFGAAERDVTFGRYTKSDGSFDFTAMSAPTLNGANAYPLVGPVVISEIMYHPSEPGSFEFIEIYNATGSDVELYDIAHVDNTWKLAGAVDFTFPAGVVIGANSFALVVPTDESTFRSSHAGVPAGASVFGPYSGQLDNAGESIRLFKPGEPEAALVPYILVERVKYDDEAPWPDGANGDGTSLQRNVAGEYGNDGVNWMAVGDGGSPGIFLPAVTITYPEIGDGFLVPFSTLVTVAVNSNLLVGTVHEIQLFEGMNHIGAMSVAPYEFTVDQNHFMSAGNYTLTAKLVDDAGTNVSPEVGITVYTNTPSVSIDTRDQTISALDPVILSATVDGDGLPPGLIATIWARHDGPGMVDFGDPNAPATTAYFPGAAGLYVLRLTATFGNNLTISEYVTITVIGSNTLNRIPYRESFERYDHGTLIAGMSGWDAADRNDAVVVTNDYGTTYNGIVPIPEEPHNFALQVDGFARDDFTGTETQTHVWIDLMLECKPWEHVESPVADADIQFGIYVDTNQQLVVWHCPDPVGEPSSNAWTKLTGAVVGSNEWIRLSLEADYSRDVNGFFHFRLWTNGVAITNDYEWFAAADTNNNHFSGFSVLGDYRLDDLVVENYNTLALRKITASSGLYGTIDPSGDVLVNIGGGTNFSMVASNYYHVDDVMIDGSESQGAINNYVFTNVTANHTIDASFAADLASHETPVWWLEQHSLGTNEADVIADGDGDRSLTWEEYVAGTDPTQSTSRFHIVITDASANVLVSCSTIGADGAGYEEVDRYYDLEDSSDPLIGTWQPVPGYTNLVGDGSTVTHTNDLSNPPRFYRVKTWLQ